MRCNEVDQRCAPALEFDAVCFSYTQEEVLHNVNLKVETGSLVAVVGPNGGGKSTLVKMALGLLKPRRGAVWVWGNAPERMRCKIGYVPQYFEFDASFPVNALDVVLMGRAERHWIGPYRRRDREAAMRALERVHLSHLSHRAFSMLSGGERQRVLIAQALASDPELLILDEPTANVDAAVEHQIYEFLHQLNREITIVVVSHNLSVVTRHASHVACVNRTATLHPMDALSRDSLHTVYGQDLAVLQHGDSCHVINPDSAPHDRHCAFEQEAPS